MISASLVPEYFRGLPLHILVIHATVVLLPLTAIGLVLAAFSSAIRTRLGIVLPLAGVLTVPLVWFTTETGQAYKDTLDGRGLVNQTLNEHANAAEQMLPWAIGLAIMTIAVYALVLLGRRLAPRFVGGPLVLLKNGDIVRLDLPGRRLDMLVDEAELARRKAAWTAPEPRFQRGWGYLFSKHVTQADKGCDFDFLERGFGPAAGEPDIF